MVVVNAPHKRFDAVVLGIRTRLESLDRTILARVPNRSHHPER